MARPSAALWLALLVLTSSAARAQTEADVKDAGGVIMQQLEAFRRDDFDTAFGFASDQVHQLFDRARFEQMVRSGYPEIARSASAVIDGVERGDGGRLYLLVKVRGANGRVVEAIYEMVPEAGRWRINGVVTRPDSSEKT